MKRVRARGRLRVSALVISAALGFAAGWVVRGHPPEPVRTMAADFRLPSLLRKAAPAPAAAPSASDPDANGPRDAIETAGSPALAAAVEALHRKDLRVPIDGVNPAAWRGQFAEAREAGGRAHEAVDILAPRDTAVHAVEDGTIAKLFFSKGGGGNTIYQFDPSGRFCYYYAHLDRYAAGLQEAQHVSRGDLIGYVGTSGNAPPQTPHLHFAIFELNAERQWWKGQPIDPYLAFHHQ